VGIGEELPEARDGDLTLVGVQVISYGLKLEVAEIPLDVVLDK